MTARLRFISASALSRRGCLTRLFGKDEENVEADNRDDPRVLTTLMSGTLSAHPFAKNAKEWGTPLQNHPDKKLRDGRSKRSVLIGRGTGVATFNESQSIDHRSAGTAERSGQGGQGLPFIFVRIVNLDGRDRSE